MATPATAITVYPITSIVPLPVDGTHFRRDWILGRGLQGTRGGPTHQCPKHPSRDGLPRSIGPLQDRAQARQRRGGHPIADIALQRLQLLVFYTKHLSWTQVEFDIDNISVNDINRLKEQKKLEKDWLKQNPEHKLDPMQLDSQWAAKCFDQVTTILRRICSVMGVPLSYVVRHRLIPDEDNGNTPMGGQDSRFTSYDKEMEGRAPILHQDADVEHPQILESKNYEEFKKDGPFHKAFLSDTRKAWLILHAFWSGTAAWHHVKTLNKMQNGQQVYRTLHHYFFGGNKVATLTTGILLTLQNLTYTGDLKNFNSGST